MESNNTGSVFFSLKNNSGNGRGWKISLNKVKKQYFNY